MRKMFLLFSVLYVQIVYAVDDFSTVESEEQSGISLSQTQFETMIDDDSAEFCAKTRDQNLCQKYSAENNIRKELFQKIYLKTSKEEQSFVFLAAIFEMGLKSDMCDKNNNPHPRFSPFDVCKFKELQLSNKQARKEFLFEGDTP